jgi:hypothetical protein
MNNEHAEYISRCETAFNQFVEATPSFVNSEANCRNLVASLDRLGLTYDRASHLEIAYRSINSKKAAPAPAPEPLEAAIEKEALRLLDSGEIDEALAHLNAKQFENRTYNKAFARGLEIREERRVKQTLARGDLVAAEQRAHQQGTSPVSEIAASEKRMIQAQNPYPASPRTERSRGIENTHNMGTSSTRRKQTAERAEAQRKADNAWIEEQEAMGARRRRVLAHRNGK